MSWNDSRPMSPHLQVYDLPITAKLSILHRATGAFLFSGLFLIVLTLLAIASGEHYWLKLQWLLNTWLGTLFIISLIFSLYYHLSTGIRHLLWDSGRFMEKQTQNISAVIVIASASLLTLLTCLIAWF